MHLVGSASMVEQPAPCLEACPPHSYEVSFAHCHGCCVFRTSPATHSNPNPPAIPIQSRHSFRSGEGHSFRLEEGHQFRFDKGHSIRFKPATSGGLIRRTGRHFLLLRPALIEVVPLISILSAPVTRRSKMASATVGLLLPR